MGVPCLCLCGVCHTGSYHNFARTAFAAAFFTMASFIDAGRNALHLAIRRGYGRHAYFGVVPSTLPLPHSPCRRNGAMFIGSRRFGCATLARPEISDRVLWLWAR